MLFDKIFRNKYHHLIVLALKEDADADELKKINGLFEAVNEKNLYEICAENEVESIVAHTLMRTGIKNLRESWNSCYSSTNKRIGAYLAEVNDLAKLFADSGIDLIVLKNGGICLGLMSNPGLCPMGDVDTLVRKSDFLKAHEILLRAGYELEFRSKLEKNDINEAFKDGGAEYFKVLNNSEKFWFELSWRSVSGRWIRPDQEPDTEELISRSLIIPGSRARMLSSEDNLLQVALHTAKHTYVRAPGFRLHLDVERIVKNSKINWTSFLEQVLELKVKTPVYFSLYLAKLLFATPIPEEILQALQPWGFKRKLMLWWIDKVGLMYPKRPKFSRWGYIAFTCLQYDSLSGLLRGVFPKYEWLKERYEIEHAAYLPYYILKRIYNLLFKRLS